MTSRVLLAAVAAVAILSTSCKKSDAPANPPAAASNEQAPDTVRVRFETTKGPFVVEAYRAWSPHGVDRFYQLAKSGFYNDIRFYRVIGGFMAQFGMSGDPKLTAAWKDRPIPDDPVAHTNERGTVTFAATGNPNSRTTQLFVNYRDNSNLDGMGFAPIGRVTEGMAVVDSLYSGYGEGAPDGNGPDQIRAMAEGNSYLDSGFPKLDRVTKATLITP
jgi:peptidyl-prolyl cis-trans isomerase A (cyclophilin A)